MTTPNVQALTIEGIQLGVHVIGEGTPVLLLHGWGGNIDSMYPIAKRLAKAGFACHTLDLPGFGMAQMPPHAWTVARYAQCVRAYMDHAALDHVHLIGHSFGGRISIMMGAEYPAHVQKIVLANSAGVRLPPSNKMRLYRLNRTLIFTLLRLPFLKQWEPSVRAWFWERYGSLDAKNARAKSEVLYETFKLVVNQDLTIYAAQIEAPTLLIWGELDTDTPLQIAHILEKTIPDAGLVVFENTGHYAYLDRPVDFVRIVSHFFSE